MHYLRLPMMALAVALLSVSLMGCSTSGNAVVARSIPGPPVYLKPVNVAVPVLGEDPIAIAARERAGRIQANRIISKAAVEWSNIVADFSRN